MTTTEELTEQIARALRRHDAELGGWSDRMMLTVRVRDYIPAAEQVMAVVGPAIQAARAEVLTDAADAMGEWGDELIIVARDAFDEDTWYETTVGDWLRQRAEREKGQNHGS